MIANFVTQEQYEELVNKVENIYNEIIKIVNSKKKTKFIEDINVIYSDIEEL